MLRKVYCVCKRHCGCGSLLSASYLIGFWQNMFVVLQIRQYSKLTLWVKKLLSSSLRGMWACIYLKKIDCDYKMKHDTEAAGLRCSSK